MKQWAQHAFCFSSAECLRTFTLLSCTRLSTLPFLNHSVPSVLSCIIYATLTLLGNKHVHICRISNVRHVLISKVFMGGNQRNVLLGRVFPGLWDKESPFSGLVLLRKVFGHHGMEESTVSELGGQGDIREAAWKFALRSGQDRPERAGCWSTFPPPLVPSGLCPPWHPVMKGDCREEEADVLGTCFPTTTQPDAKYKGRTAVAPVLGTSWSIMKTLKPAISAQARHCCGRGNAGAMRAHRVPLLAGTWSARASWKK